MDSELTIKRNKVALSVAGATFGAILGALVSKNKNFIAIASYSVLFYQFAQVFGDIYYIRKIEEK